MYAGFWSTIIMAGIGNKFGNKGVKRPKEITDKIFATRRKNVLKRGYWHSKETKEKMRISNTGKKRSKEALIKMSLAHKRRLPESYLRGEKCPFWKGGVNGLSDTIRHRFKYRQWRSDVFQRDDYTCQSCGIRGASIQADHIKPFAFLIFKNKISSIDEAESCEELWNIDNGRTLCIPCHRKTDTYGGKYFKNYTHKL